MNTLKVILLTFISFSISLLLLSCNGNSKNDIVDSLNKKQQNILPAKKTINQWLGKWNRDDWQNEAEVDITKITGDSLTFDMDAASGGHTGEIEGKAFIKANQAFYKSDEGTNCSLILTLKGDSVITIAATGCEGEGGMGVVFDGKYVNAKLVSKTKRKTDEPTLVTLEVLNKDEDAAFRKVVGKSYELFLNSTQLTDDDVKDLDDMHAKIRASGVRGLFTLQENIIMVDSAKNVCAAVLDDGKVYYFSSNINYKDKLPKTIEDWRSRFAEAPVVFQSK